MGSRHRGREIALQVLYQVDVTSHSSEKALTLFQENFNFKEDSWAFAKDLVTGICENSGEIEIVVELTEGGGLEVNPDRVVIIDRVFNVFDLFKEDMVIFKEAKRAV